MKQWKVEGMPIIEDELWKNPGNPGMIVMTSHSSIEEDGRLFMGCGEGLEAIRRIPGIDVQCGSQILAHAVDGVYGFLPVRPSRPQEKKIGFGIFQTRYHWNEYDDPELIRYSMDCLRQYIDANSGLRIRMNYPSLEEGGLAMEEVLRLLEPVPPAVTICYRGEAAPLALPGMGSVKELYLLIERWLQEGRFSFAVEYLMSNGYDRQEAVEQVSAVQRELRAVAEKYATEKQRQLF